MTFEPPDDFVWDFWTATDDQRQHHLFFLHAPRALGDPDLRHRHARVGHAVSTDLRAWTRLPDPLPPPAPGAHDDLATWTGCTVRADDGWRLFTSGISSSDDGHVQRIGVARSRDLVTWQRDPLVLEAASPHYEQRGPSCPDESWRDPYVVRAEDGLWHMYVTARGVRGSPGGGVVGHAVSDDLDNWEVRPPLSAPAATFAQLEVISVVQVEGRWVLLFSCLSPEMPGAPTGSGGVWSVPVDGPGCPVDVAAAVRLTDESLYVGRVVHHAGAAYFLAFRHQDEAGRFVGGVIDPVPVTWRPDGRGLALRRTT